MLLCEVALGTPKEYTIADYHADQAHVRGGKLSTKGMGTTHPDPKEQVVLEDGCIVPLGNGIDSGVTQSSLLYNEYIVYNTKQVKMKYLLKMKFIY